MKLKIIMLLGLLALTGNTLLGMFKNAARNTAEGLVEKVDPNADNLAEALFSPKRIQDLTLNAMIGLEKGVARTVGAHPRANLAESINCLLDKTIESRTQRLEQDIEQLLDRTQDKAINSIETMPGRLKNDLVSYIKVTFNNLKSRLIIGGVAILAYYLIKKYTNPGSLNKCDLNKSSLVVESSGFVNGPMARIASMFKSEKTLKKLTLSPDISQKAKAILSNFVAAIKKLRTKSPGFNFNSLLLNGPKGTGKTLFVDHLIKISHLDYIKINGSSFINFEDGTESKAVSSIFNLLKKPKKEIIFVVEDADILLNRPAYKNKLLDLLRWIKTNNTKFMLIICAENKKSLDKEVIDLIDNNIELALPEENDRKKYLVNNVEIMLEPYEATELGQILASIFNDEKINQIAKQTTGLSYRNLEVLLDNIKLEILNYGDQYTKEFLNDAVQNGIALKSALAV